MNLRMLAEQDLATTLEDGVTGFGWPVILTTPDGEVVKITAQSNDISLTVDPQTGVVVSGRQASAVVRISTLTAEGVCIPVGVAKRDARPWVVQFTDINGGDNAFKVTDSFPDRTLGIVVLHLEAWKP